MRSPNLLLLGACACALIGAGCSSSSGPTAPAPVVSGSGNPSPTSGPSPTPATAAPTARYRFMFEATWSAATHPQDFPADAHFSRIVGGTHGPSVRFWSEGTTATDGIRDMAERGRTTPLDNEVRAAIASGSAQFLLLGGDIPRSPGVVTLEFEISQAHPLVTIVSMVAPSPDWFVGVSALPLFENGQWVDRRSVDVGPWDAGTDSGTTFTSPDQPTVPRRPVSRITGFPFLLNGTVGPLGRFTFERLP